MGGSLHAATPAMRVTRAAALVLRGGELSILRADLSRPEFVHSVLLGLLANSLAMHLCTLAAAQLSPQLGSGDKPRGRVSSAVDTLVWHFTTVVAGFAAYFLVFRLTGFVPMGYVVGARPAIPLFEPPM